MLAPLGNVAIGAVRIMPSSGMLASLWHLYLIECADGSLYAGIATDVERRYRAHLSGKGARYTRSHKPLRLLTSRPFASRSEALRAELAIKRLPKEKKLAALLSPDLLKKSDTHDPTTNDRQRSHSVNRAELIEIVAEESDMTKAAAEKALVATIGAITKAVSKGDSVTLVGFGTFSSSKRAARTGRNPQTGKELKIAATTVAKFKAGANFKTAVSGKKAAKKK